MCDVNLWIILSTLRTWSRRRRRAIFMCGTREFTQNALFLSLPLSPALSSLFRLRFFPLISLVRFYARSHSLDFIFYFYWRKHLNRKKKCLTCKHAIISRDANRNTAERERRTTSRTDERASERSNVRKRRTKIPVICLQRKKPADSFVPRPLFLHSFTSSAGPLVRVSFSSPASRERNLRALRLPIKWRFDQRHEKLIVITRAASIVAARPPIRAE